MKLSKDTQSVIDRCNLLIKEYGEKCKLLSGDNLLDMKDRLSVAYCYLGEVEAEYFKDAAIAYKNRKIVMSSNIATAISEGQAISRANAEADNDPDAQSARYDEITKSYLAHSVKNLLKGIDRVLSVIDYPLKRLRDERKTP